VCSLVICKFLSFNLPAEQLYALVFYFFLEHKKDSYKAVFFLMIKDYNLIFGFGGLGNSRKPILKKVNPKTAAYCSMIFEIGVPAP
jgi:hypothetical protein